jgi:hypothetical protein
VSGIPAGWAWSFDKSAEVMDRCQGAVILALVKYQLGDDHLLPSEYAHYRGRPRPVEGFTDIDHQ